MICDKCKYFTSTYKDLGIHQRIMHEDLSSASDCKIFKPSFENKNSCNLCDLISTAILCLETHSKVNIPTLRILYTYIEAFVMNNQYMTLYTKFNLGKYTTFFALFPLTLNFFFVLPVIQSSVIHKDCIASHSIKH